MIGKQFLRALVVRGDGFIVEPPTTHSSAGSK